MIINFAAIVFSIDYFMQVCLILSNFRRDSTDQHPNEGVECSGLILYTDYGTGVQYVEDVRGGLTPRINPNRPAYNVEQDKRLNTDDRQR